MTDKKYSDPHHLGKKRMGKVTGEWKQTGMKEWLLSEVKEKRKRIGKKGKE